MTIPSIVAWLQAASMTLSVQVVDGGWLAIPGVTIAVQRVSSCDGPVPSDPARVEHTTGSEGWADFPAQPNGKYRITFSGVGGFRRVDKCVQIAISDPPQAKAYVQIQLLVRIPRGDSTDQHRGAVDAASGRDENARGAHNRFRGLRRGAADR